MNVRDAFYEILRTHGITTIAAAYGVQSEQVKTLADLTRAVKDALSADKPHLIEISERRLADS
jgi:thiamine pyrophosphate-dependent acetolactate synthase large subunit-like protein